MLAQILILMLMFDAAIVFVGQVLHWNVWALVCAYWLILTIKNAVDYINNKRKDKNDDKIR